MGILDTGISKTNGLQKNQTRLYDQTPSPINPTVNSAVDCSNFNTIQVVCSAYVNNIEFYARGYYSSGENTEWQGDIPIIEITDFSIKPTTVIQTGQVKTLLIDVSRFSKIAFGTKSGGGNLRLSYNMDQSMRAFEIMYMKATPPEVQKVSFTTSDPYEDKGFERIASNDAIDIYTWTKPAPLNLRAVHNNVCVWSDHARLHISLTGIKGDTEVIALNGTNFPNLIDGSLVERVVLMPWSRNATTGFAGNQWRMNVITDKGQIYHNFPSRSKTSDGEEQAGDYKRFDESVVWDMESRKHPVRTKTGEDLALIETGVYRYFPCLPPDSYTLIPSVNRDNGYGNSGHPAFIQKTTKDGTVKRMSRFWLPTRSNPDCNSFSYMGGFEAGAKLTVLGTYRKNTLGAVACRICTFATNDGGRNWYTIYEFGVKGEILNEKGEQMYKAENTKFSNCIFTGTSVGSGVFTVLKRSIVSPDADTKEPTKSFKHSAKIPVSSITGDGRVTITTASAHNLVSGDSVVFNASAAPAEWDWITNNTSDDTSAGNGVIFIAEVISATSFFIHVEVHNPSNNLCARHIHAVNRCKDGFTIGSGETYPSGGWILWLECRESDTFELKNPWDNHKIIRLNSTKKSIQRPLGVVVKQTPENTVYIGVDNEYTDIGTVTMPAGRTETFRRSSNGLFKGKLIDVDDQAKFECVFESPEVCYLFKEIMGAMIYIGQQRHIGISIDNGASWIQTRLDSRIGGNFYHFGGVTPEREIVIDNILIVLK